MRGTYGRCPRYRGAANSARVSSHQFLEQPLEPGGGRVALGGLDPFSDAPGFYTGIFTMTDPLQNRRIMGIGRVDLVNKKIDFKPVGPARGLAFSVAPVER